MDFESKIKPEDLSQLNDKVYDRGHVDREHLLEFLTLIPTNDGDHIKKEVKNWLHQLHLDPKFDKVRFTGSTIDAVVDDLESYGRVKAKTILQLQEPDTSPEAPTE